MKLYHTYDSSRGFNLDKLDFERGIFSIEPWWKGRPGYEKYSEFEPNEFGDKVVELDVNEKSKTYTTGDQFDILEKYFPNSLFFLASSQQKFC